MQCSFYIAELGFSGQRAACKGLTTQIQARDLCNQSLTLRSLSAHFRTFDLLPPSISYIINPSLFDWSRTNLKRKEAEYT